MVRRRVSAVSNNEAPGADPGLILRDAAQTRRSSQDEEKKLLMAQQDRLAAAL
jgi:hypothetical protein